MRAAARTWQLHRQSPRRLAACAEWLVHPDPHQPLPKQHRAPPAVQSAPGMSAAAPRRASPAHAMQPHTAPTTSARQRALGAPSAACGMATQSRCRLRALSALGGPLPSPQGMGARPSGHTPHSVQPPSAHGPRAASPRCFSRTADHIAPERQQQQQQQQQQQLQPSARADKSLSAGDPANVAALWEGAGAPAVAPPATLLGLSALFPVGAPTAAAGAPTAAGADVALSLSEAERLASAHAPGAVQPHAAAGAAAAGYLEVITGPMFAGKSTALLRRVMELQAQGRSVVVVKSAVDKRYAHHWVVAHSGLCVPCFAASTLAEFGALVAHLWRAVEVVAVDEAQFFPDLVAFCGEAADRDGKDVIVAGLSGDYRRKPFGQVLELIPMADKVTLLEATCHTCGSPARFSARAVREEGQQLVGGADKYRAACRRCYKQYSVANHP